uniref:Uncharacterized protein n=1 Tax=Pseudomonas syringae pv. actinidiae TaxID=103796 RepID=M1IMC9_PSESF|nr:hypothetical protein [Pseudomonas syringae pv. actinidiae]
MLSVKRPQDAGKDLPGVTFFCNTGHTRVTQRLNALASELDQ